MGNSKIEDVLAGMTAASKKETLDNLVIAILSELNETEKKDLLCTVARGQKENRHLASMVEY